MSGNSDDNPLNFSSLPLYNRPTPKRQDTWKFVALMVIAISIILVFGAVVTILAYKTEPAVYYDTRVVPTPGGLIMPSLDIKEARQEPVKLHEGDVTSGDEAVTETGVETSSSHKAGSVRTCKLQDYDIGDEIGKGGFGRVYLGTRTFDKATFAIKAYQSTAKGEKQFGLERQFLGQLRHPYVVRLHCTCVITEEEADAHGLEGRYIMIMDYASNGTMFKRRLDRKAVVRKWFAQLVLALEFVHSKGILHQDIKSGNVLIDENEDIRLADFGLATYYDPMATTSRWVGTKIYFPPERINREKVSYSADIYSLGILFYHFYGAQALPRFDKKNEDKEALKAQLLEFAMNAQKKELIPGASPEVYSLYQGMVHPNASERLTIRQIKAHPYFKKVDWGKLTPTA